MRMRTTVAFLACNQWLVGLWGIEVAVRCVGTEETGVFVLPAHIPSFRVSYRTTWLGFGEPRAHQLRFPHHNKILHRGTEPLNQSQTRTRTHTLTPRESSR
jgi:hypothetical protein